MFNSSLPYFLLGYMDETNAYLDLLLKVPFELLNLLKEALLAPSQL